MKGESCEDSKNMADMLEIMPPIARKKYFESIEFKTHVPEETQQLLMGGGPEAPITPPVSGSVGGLSAMEVSRTKRHPQRAKYRKVYERVAECLTYPWV